jgi:hypothetical protein
MSIEASFEEIVKNKAKHMSDAASWKNQAIKLGVKGEEQLKAFKIGGWDAMIFDMAQSLNYVRYAQSEFRRNLIDRWLREGL